MSELICHFGAEWDKDLRTLHAKKLRHTFTHALKLFSNSRLHSNFLGVHSKENTDFYVTIPKSVTMSRQWKQTTQHISQ